MVGAVATARNNLTFAESVGLAYGIAAIFSADAEELGGLKAPMLIGGADGRGQAAFFKVAQGHLGGLGVDSVGRDANHGADGTKLKMYELAPDSEILIMPSTPANPW